MNDSLFELDPTCCTDVGLGVDESCPLGNLYAPIADWTEPVVVNDDESNNNSLKTGDSDTKSDTIVNLPQDAEDPIDFVVSKGEFLLKLNAKHVNISRRNKQKNNAVLGSPCQVESSISRAGTSDVMSSVQQGVDHSVQQAEVCLGVDHSVQQAEVCLGVDHLKPKQHTYVRNSHLSSHENKDLDVLLPFCSCEVPSSCRGVVRASTLLKGGIPTVLSNLKSIVICDKIVTAFQKNSDTYVSIAELRANNMIERAQWLTRNKELLTLSDNEVEYLVQTKLISNRKQRKCTTLRRLRLYFQQDTGPSGCDFSKQAANVSWYRLPIGHVCSKVSSLSSKTSYMTCVCHRCSRVHLGPVSLKSRKQLCSECKALLESVPNSRPQSTVSYSRRASTKSRKKPASFVNDDSPQDCVEVGFIHVDSRAICAFRKNGVTYVNCLHFTTFLQRFPWKNMREMAASLSVCFIAAPIQVARYFIGRRYPTPIMTGSIYCTLEDLKCVACFAIGQMNSTDFLVLNPILTLVAQKQFKEVFNSDLQPCPPVEYAPTEQSCVEQSSVVQSRLSVGGSVTVTSEVEKPQPEGAASQDVVLCTDRQQIPPGQYTVDEHAAFTDYVGESEVYRIMKPSTAIPTSLGEDLTSRTNESVDILSLATQQILSAAEMATPDDEHANGHCGRSVGSSPMSSARGQVPCGQLQSSEAAESLMHAVDAQENDLRVMGSRQTARSSGTPVESMLSSWNISGNISDVGGNNVFVLQTDSGDTYEYVPLGLLEDLEKNKVLVTSSIKSSLVESSPSKLSLVAQCSVAINTGQPSTTGNDACHSSGPPENTSDSGISEGSEWHSLDTQVCFDDADPNHSLTNPQGNSILRSPLGSPFKRIASPGRDRTDIATVCSKLVSDEQANNLSVLACVAHALDESGSEPASGTIVSAGIHADSSFEVRSSIAVTSAVNSSIAPVTSSAVNSPIAPVTSSPVTSSAVTSSIAPVTSAVNSSISSVTSSAVTSMASVTFSPVTSSAVTSAIAPVTSVAGQSSATGVTADSVARFDQFMELGGLMQSKDTKSTALPVNPTFNEDGHCEQVESQALQEDLTVCQDGINFDALHLKLSNIIQLQNEKRASGSQLKQGDEREMERCEEERLSRNTGSCEATSLPVCSDEASVVPVSDHPDETRSLKPYLDIDCGRKDKIDRNTKCKKRKRLKTPDKKNKKMRISSVDKSPKNTIDSQQKEDVESPAVTALDQQMSCGESPVVTALNQQMSCRESPVVTALDQQMSCRESPVVTALDQQMSREVTAEDVCLHRPGQKQQTEAASNKHSDIDSSLELTETSPGGKSSKGDDISLGESSGLASKGDNLSGENSLGLSSKGGNSSQDEKSMGLSSKGGDLSGDRESGLSSISDLQLCTTSLGSADRQKLLNILAGVKVCHVTPDDGTKRVAFRLELDMLAVKMFGDEARDESQLVDRLKRLMRVVSLLQYLQVRGRTTENCGRVQEHRKRSKKLHGRTRKHPTSTQSVSRRLARAAVSTHVQVLPIDPTRISVVQHDQDSSAVCGSNSEVTANNSPDAVLDTACVYSPKIIPDSDRSCLTPTLSPAKHQLVSSLAKDLELSDSEDASLSVKDFRIGDLDLNPARFNSPSSMSVKSSLSSFEVNVEVHGVADTSGADSLDRTIAASTTPSDQMGICAEESSGQTISGSGQDMEDNCSYAEYSGVGQNVKDTSREKLSDSDVTGDSGESMIDGNVEKSSDEPSSRDITLTSVVDDQKTASTSSDGEVCESLTETADSCDQWEESTNEGESSKFSTNIDSDKVNSDSNDVTIYTDSEPEMDFHPKTSLSTEGGIMTCSLVNIKSNYTIALPIPTQMVANKTITGKPKFCQSNKSLPPESKCHDDQIKRSPLKMKSNKETKSSPKHNTSAIKSPKKMSVKTLLKRNSTEHVSSKGKWKAKTDSESGSRVHNETNAQMKGRMKAKTDSESSPRVQSDDSVHPKGKRKQFRLTDVLPRKKKKLK